MDGFDINYDVEVMADKYEEYQGWLNNGGLEELYGKE